MSPLGPKKPEKHYVKVMQQIKLDSIAALKWDVQHWGFGSLFWNSLMQCLAERPSKNKKIYIWATFDSFVIFYFLFLFFRIFLEFFFVCSASPGSAGCFKKATETPNAGHPIYSYWYLNLNLPLGL
jgi:hypothetical protein